MKFHSEIHYKNMSFNSRYCVGVIVKSATETCHLIPDTVLMSSFSLGDNRQKVIICLSLLHSLSLSSALSYHLPECQEILKVKPVDCLFFDTAL